MEHHFESFTAEGMRAFVQSLAGGVRERMEFVDKTRRETQAFREDARATLGRFVRENRDRAAELRGRLAAHTSQRAQDERDRRRGADRDREARRVAQSEVRSGIHALLGRFQLNRQAVAQDLAKMAAEVKAASDAWKNRGTLGIKAALDTSMRFVDKTFLGVSSDSGPTMTKPREKDESGGSGKKRG